MSDSASYRIFLSGVSNEVGRARSAVASDLRARGLTVKVQEDFRQEEDAETTLQKMHNYVKECDAVVCLMGTRSGQFPPGAAAEPYQHLLPEGFTKLSYTQWEYVFAKHYSKRLSVYLTDPNFTAEGDASAKDDADSQAAFVQEYLKDTVGQDRTYFVSADQLRWQVLREKWPEILPQKPIELPFRSMGSLFKGRLEFLEQLESRLQDAGAAGVVAAQPIHGIGGVGKTRAAVEYAWRHHDDYTALLFVSGDSWANLRRSFAELVGPLVLDIKAAQATEEEEVRFAEALKWLQKHPGWFLIVDNVDDDETQNKVTELLTKLTAGHVVITSRIREWAADVETLDLDVLTEDDACAFLEERTAAKRKQDADRDAEDVRNLANDLDGLALALEQAGAYIAFHETSYAEYHELWKEHDEKVLEWDDKWKKPNPQSIATTWLTSFSMLNLPARKLLQILSFFAPDPIPEWVLTDEAAAEHWQNALGDHKPIEVLAELKNYSLIRRDRNTDPPQLQVHRLVQQITRYRMKKYDEEQGAKEDTLTKTRLQSALDVARSVMPAEADDVRTWPQWEPMAPHVDSLCVRGEQELIGSPTWWLMNGLATFYQSRAVFQRSENFFCSALSIAEQSFGEHHFDVASRLNNLAELYRETNRMSEAEPLYRRALAIHGKHYGENCPSDAVVLNNLALLLQETNRMSEAESLYRRALAIDERHYGENHPNVARDLNNLATLLLTTNRVSEAEPLMRRALAINEQSFGESHPYVATSLNDLAMLLRTTNQLNEAESLLRLALKNYEHSYGKYHPRVAVALSNLALILKETNQTGEAERLYRRALVINEKCFGENHPRVATQLNNLGALLQATNRLNEAESSVRRALAIDEQSYGQNHPIVAIRLNNLAMLLKATSRLTEAEPLMRRALAISERSYGESHPDVAAILWCLASLLSETGHLNEAKPLLRRALVVYCDFTRSTGHQHPHLAGVINNYTDLLQQMEVPMEEIIQRLIDAGVDLDWLRD